MTLLRWAGAALLTGACAAGGLAAAQARRAEWQRIHTFTCLLDAIEGGIRYRACPCPQLLAQLERSGRFPGMGLANCRDFGALPVPPALGPALCEETRETLAQLGGLPRQRACATLDRLLHACRLREEEADRTAREAARLYPRLGVCAGILLVLMML